MVARTNRAIVAFLQFFTFIVTLQSVYAAYLGKFIGKLSELHHGVSGEVYAIDAKTLHLKDFTYDGQGPAAYFYAGNTRVPGSGGFRLTDENGNPEVIRRYRKENVILTLPDGKTLNSIKWFSVWCEEFTVNFGDVKIPRNFDYPRPRKIDPLRGVHGVSSDNIIIVDAQTLLIPNLSYDGEAPDAKFWVGRGSKPSPQGVRVPDENGKEEPLRRYNRKTVVLTLPGDLTVFDIGHFGIWCEAFTVDFGHIQIPGNLNVPPSLRMLGVSPQKRPRSFDYTEVSKPQVRQLVGGHVEATTFRPAQFIHQLVQQPLIIHRSDVPEIKQQNNYFHNANLISQPQLLNNHLQTNHSPQLYTNQPHHNQEFIQRQQQEFLQQHQRYIQNSPQPLSLQQQHQLLREKFYHDQLVQTQQRLQEEHRLRGQLSAQYINRFDIPNNYSPIG